MRLSALSGAMVVVCTVANCVTAQSFTTYSSNSQSLTEQIIPAAQRAHDFGTVARAAKTEHRFEIRNPFKQPMHLSSISASCGCTTPIIETKVIQPGETGSVVARFNTGTFSGDRKASLNLTIDQPSFMQLQLNVKGYIRSDIVINPGELNFGTVPEGEIKEVEATVEYAGRSDWKITGVSSNSTFISASFEELQRSAGRVTYKIKAKLSPDGQTGAQATMITLQTNDNRLKSVPLAVNAQIQAPLSVSPTSVALGEMKRGQPITQRILVKGTEPFQILDVQVPDMQVSFEPSTEAKVLQFLNVTITPESTLSSGDGKARMTIFTDMGGEREISLDVNYKFIITTENANSELSEKVSSRLMHRSR